MTDGDTHDLAVAPEDDRVAEALLRHGGDLLPEIQALEDRVVSRRNLFERVLDRGELVRRLRLRGDGLREDRDERPRPEPVRLVQAEVLRARAKVKRPAWRTPQRSNAPAPAAGAACRCPGPSGRDERRAGPKYPNDPKRVAKTAPTTSPPVSATHAQSGAARNRVRTRSASPNVSAGSGRPRNVRTPAARRGPPSRGRPRSSPDVHCRIHDGRA